MGVIELLLDAVSVALTSVGGGFGWWTPGGKCSTDFALTHALDAKSLRFVLASHADQVGTSDFLLAKARLIASASWLSSLCTRKLVSIFELPCAPPMSIPLCWCEVVAK